MSTERTIPNRTADLNALPVGTIIKGAAYCGGDGIVGESKRETVYISGPMSGLPDFNYPAFDAKSDELCDRYWVRNPAWILGGDSWTWQHWMRAALKMQMDADVVHMLPGWRKSRGARIERRLALILGQRVEGADA